MKTLWMRLGSWSTPGAGDAESEPGTAWTDRFLTDGRERGDMKVRTVPALAAIFGILLTLIVFTSAAVYQKTNELKDRYVHAQGEYRKAAALLVDVRRDIYESMFAVQNYLLDPADESRGRALEDVAKTRNSTNAHLKELQTHFEARASGQLQALVSKLDQHWLISVEALNSVSAREPAWRRLSEGTAALADALQITRDMDDLNVEELRLQDGLAQQRSDSFFEFLFWTTCATFGLGLVVSIASLAGIRRNEQESQAQTRKAQAAEAGLRQLSQQLLRAQEEERKNISRELHDEVGQLLTGLRIELGNLQRSLSENGAFASRIEEAKGLAEQSLRSIRNMAMLLRPSMLDDQGFAPSIKWQAKEFSRRFDIPVSVEIEGEVDRLPSGHGVCLYRVIQEVLTNSAKHANARNIKISVNAQADSVFASVEDDGAGFQVPAQEQSGGIGLLGIAERIRELQGTLKISSELGRGTRIEVELPIQTLQTNEEAYSSTR
jgi:signal transduction histidine kinase